MTQKAIREEPAMWWRIFCAALGLVFRCVVQLIHLTLRLTRGSAKGTLPPITDPLLLEPATVLAAKIRSKRISSEALVKSFIQRIKSVEPFLNAVVENRFEAALKEAREADQYVLNSGKTPEQLAQEKPFLGVPFTTKDAIPVQGLALTAGVVARKGIKAKEDCVVVANVRASGAIPLCVSNVPEICMWIDGSNKLYGTTNNAYDLTRSPGGSSGGEGSLISAAASVMGLGNDIGGSIRIPCSFSGIFGHKPTRRVNCNKGQWPCTHDHPLDHYNCTGPMCRYAVDLLPLLKVIAAENVSKLKLDTQVNMKTVKVYYTEDYITQGFTSKLDPEIAQTVREVVQQLEKNHGVQVKKVSIPLINKAWTVWLTKIGTPGDWADLTVNNSGSVNIFLELFKSMLRRSVHTLHCLYFLLLCKIWSSPKFDKVNLENEAISDELTKTFTDMLGSDGVFIFPTNANTAMYHNEQLLKLSNFAYTGLFSFLGNPVTQCPIKLSSEGLPIGVQVVGNHHHDHLTLAVAKELEKIFGGWKSPSPFMK